MSTIVRAVSGYTYSGHTDLSVMTCPTCGITYAMPERLRADAEARGNRERVWYCPNGHELGYNDKSEEQRLRRQLEGAQRRAGRLAAERDQIEASRRAQKAATTRARNQRDRDRKRVAAGVCPCCNRTFQNLARHMAGQHPEFGPLGEHDQEAPRG